jgi:uncharacterized FlaG/YvyC family protein
MLIKSVTGSVKNVTSPVQTGLAVERGPVSNSGEVPKEVPRPEISDIVSRVADTQRNLNIMHDKNLNFSVHQASGEIMVTVTDETSGEVIREIPSSELLNLAAKLDEMVGILFDQKG